MDSPGGLAVDAAGNLYLADTHNSRVREVNAATGLIATVATTGLALPRGLSVDAAGNIYVADSANHRVRRISPSGAMTTVAGEGTQTFAGDGAPAVAASLDSLRAVAMSPAGLVTLADSGNQRVRQLDAQPAPGPDIHTVPWVSGVAPVTLTLSGPATVTYGSGTVTATLSVNVTGSLTFLDTSNGTPVTLGSNSLGATGIATFSTGTLAAGTHSLIAAYGGDATHSAAQSSAITLTVAPLAITAAPNPASLLYGQAIPSLSGTLSGVLPQDAANVTAQFATTAAALSPPGTYPITATLAGSAAGNYTVAMSPAALSIAKAPSTVTLTNATGSVSLGLPASLTVQAASTTAGVPTGSVTLSDGATVLGTIPLSAGTAAFTTSSLAQGTHSLTATYAGDTDFLPSTSTAATVVVGTPSDFTLAFSGPASQAVPAGSAAVFNFAIATQGPALSSPILLAVQGVPNGATASLNPTSIPPGSGPANFSLTIQTPLAVLGPQPLGPITGHGWLAVLLLPAVSLAQRKSKRAAFRILLYALCLTLATFATGCGNRVNSASESSHSVTYSITVTGTATGATGAAIQHSTIVTLQVL